MAYSEGLDQGKKVVSIRDTPVSDSDPFSTDVRKRMIEYRYADEDVEAWVMPTRGHGRKVGYEVREADDIPPDIFAVSATGVAAATRRTSRRGSWSS